MILCNHYADMSLNIPGGSVDRGETLVQAVNREWSEEVMGKTSYTIRGEQMFDESDFKFKNTDKKLNIYVFIRVVTSRQFYSRLIYDMNMASLGLINPTSKWNVIDSMGGVSVPIFMEPSYDNNQKFIGFPKMIENFRYPHRVCIILCLLKSGILSSEERVVLMQKCNSYPNIISRLCSLI